MPVNIKGIPWDKTRKRDGLPPGIQNRKSILLLYRLGHRSG